MADKLIRQLISHMIATTDHAMKEPYSRCTDSACGCKLTEWTLFGLRLEAIVDLAGMPFTVIKQPRVATRPHAYITTL